MASEQVKMVIFRSGEQFEKHTNASGNRSISLPGRMEYISVLIFTVHVPEVQRKIPQPRNFTDSSVLSSVYVSTMMKGSSSVKMESEIVFIFGSSQNFGKISKKYSVGKSIPNLAIFH